MDVAYQTRNSHAVWHKINLVRRRVYVMCEKNHNSDALWLLDLYCKNRQRIEELCQLPLHDVPRTGAGRSRESWNIRCVVALSALVEK